MIVTGLRKLKKEERNDEDSKRVVSAIASEAGLDEGEFMKHVDKVLPVGCRKNGKQSRIIKFATNSFKKKVSFKYKQNKKNEIEKRKQMKIPAEKMSFSYHPCKMQPNLHILICTAI